MRDKDPQTLNSALMCAQEAVDPVIALRQAAVHPQHLLLATTPAPNTSECMKNGNLVNMKGRSHLYTILRT